MAVPGMTVPGMTVTGVAVTGVAVTGVAVPGVNYEPVSRCACQYDDLGWEITLCIHHHYATLSMGAVTQCLIHLTSS